MIERVFANFPACIFDNGNPMAECRPPVVASIDVMHENLGAPRNNVHQFLDQHFTQVAATARIDVECRHSADDTRRKPLQAYRILHPPPGKPGTGSDPCKCCRSGNRIAASELPCEHGTQHAAR